MRMIACVILIAIQGSTAWKEWNSDLRFNRQQPTTTLFVVIKQLLEAVQRGGALSPSVSAAKDDLLPKALNLTVHENLLTKEECETIINVARPFLNPSKVGRPPKVEPSLRISLSCKLPRLPIPELWSVEHKLATAAGVPVERGEDLQVGGYPVGHYYGMHCDERSGGRPNGGGRLATALAYLNNLDPDKVSGGHTVFSGTTFDLKGEPDFPVGDMRVRQLKQLCNCDDQTAVRVAPKEGRVITFRNLEPVLDGITGDSGGGAWRFISQSTHGACPVVNVTDPPATGAGAEKFVVQQWFGLESEVNVARHPRMIAHLGLGIANNYKIPPMADLGSPNGTPLAVAPDDDVHLTDVASLVPHLGATNIKGWCAQIDSIGQPGSVQSLEKGLSAAIWMKRGDGASQNATADDRPTITRLFRVGPHDLLMFGEELGWAIGRKIVRFPAVKLKPNLWHHIAITISPPIIKNNDDVNENGKIVSFDADLYVSIPGTAPTKPMSVQFSDLDNVPDWIEGITIGGCRRQEGEEGGNVDLTVTDFYAVAEELKGKGHSFAFALSFYDPQQGL